MAHIKPLSDWRRLWFFPWVQRRFVGLYLDTAPTVPVDVSSFWCKYRWTP